MIKSNNLNLFLPLGLLLAFLLSSGCDDELCKVGTTECLDTHTIQICVKDDDENKWVPLKCGEGEDCQEFGAAASVDAGTGIDASFADAATSSNNDAGTSDDEDEKSGNAMCVGTCTEDAHECVTDQLARHCVDGKRWETYRCEDGETCGENGECHRDYSQVYDDLKICDEGSKKCASDEVLKICDADQTMWIPVYCEPEEVCDATLNDCVLDTVALCDPDDGTCDDENNLIRCIENGVGYERIACPDDTRCQFNSLLGEAACVGDLCAIGSTCDNGDYEAKGEFVRNCVDGTKYEYTRCEVNERCAQITPWVAQCVPQPTDCTPGEVVCGNPDDAEVDESLFSVCVDDPDDPINGTIGARWVVHECVGDNLSCDEDAAEAGVVPPCVKECTPGEQRCAPPEDRPVDITHARQECNEDGTWSDAEPCSVGEDVYQVCARLDQLSGELPEVVCADPVCVLNGVVLVDGGSCNSETEWLACDMTTGQLAEPDEAQDCESGVCQTGLLPTETYNNTRTDDGRIRGTCLPTECEEGEQRCLRTMSGEYTTRYLTCSEEGKWETQPSTCEDNNLCLDYMNDDDQWTVICDADCVPGSQQCTGADDDETDQIRVCDEDGQWGDRTDCEFGICDPSRDECIGQCKPDEKRCVGDPKVASDDYHTGTDSEETCTDDGFWSGDDESCDDDTTCRVSGTGVVLGCVECVGPDIVGGNEDGLVDSRCDDDTVQECNSDNDGFDDITDCNGDFVCQPPSYGLMCEGYCSGASGHLVLCAEQFVQQQCEPCDTVSGLGYISECTVTALQNAGAVVTSGCAGYSSSGDYSNNLNLITATHSGADVTESTGSLRITIETSYSIQLGDYGRIQYSWDNALWNNALPTLTGNSGWTEETRTIPAASAGTGYTLYIRFQFYSNTTGVADGWKIDSVTVQDADDTYFVSEDFETNTDNWTFTGSWGTETVPGDSGDNVVVITESPGTVLDNFDFGTPGVWAGVLNDDCCSDYQTTDDTYPCPGTGTTVITNNYTDCCRNYTTAVPGASQIAWCVEED